MIRLKFAFFLSISIAVPVVTVAGQTRPTDRNEEHEYVRMHNRVVGAAVTSDTTGLAGVVHDIERFVSEYPNSLFLAAAIEDQLEALKILGSPCTEFVEVAGMLFLIDDSPQRAIYLADGIEKSRCDSDLLGDLLRYYESFGVSLSADEFAEFHRIFVSYLTGKGDTTSASQRMVDGLNRLLVEFPDARCSRKVTTLLATAVDLGIDLETDHAELRNLCASTLAN